MTNQVYDPNTPTKNLPFSQWQQKIQNNFNLLNKYFTTNHIALNAKANAGNHNIISLLKRISPLQTDLGEFNIYSKDVSGQTAQIFMRYEGNGQEFQFSNYQIYRLTDTTFFTFLPGNIIVYFGSMASSKLDLIPGVAKKIIAANFTAAQPGTIHPGSLNISYQELAKTPNGIIPGIQVITSVKSYYLVMANI